MKKNSLALILLVSLTVVLISCRSKSNNSGTSGIGSNTSSSGNAVDSNAKPIMKFETDFHDFGKLNSGELVSYSFKFKNTGKSVLLISNVGTSCGCTVTAFPKRPIQPGEESTIDVKFDSTGKHGRQSKSITIFANTEPTETTIRIQAFLVEPEDI
jgi:hypothetical protein